MITGLAHVCFTVSDLDRAIDFYQHKLGLTPAFDFRREDGTRFGIYLYFGGRNFLELFVGEIKPADGQSFKHCCFEVDDIDATLADLHAKGVAVDEKKLGKDQSWQAWLVDPDGNRIELHQYTPESWQMKALA